MSRECWSPCFRTVSTLKAVIPICRTPNALKVLQRGFRGKSASLIPTGPNLSTILGLGSRDPVFGTSELRQLLGAHRAGWEANDRGRRSPGQVWRGIRFLGFTAAGIRSTPSSSFANQKVEQPRKSRE